MRSPSAARRRRGFSLVELMVVFMIIAILFGLTAAGMQAAQITANRTKTRALITKLHAIMMARWESYQSRQLPIRPTQMVDQTDITSPAKLNVARVKLYALRELMRMEMPDRYSDLLFVPQFLVNYDPGGTPYPVEPYLKRIYLDRIKSTNPVMAEGDFDRLLQHVATDNESAECLYLVLTLGLEDAYEAGQKVSEQNVGDTDSDGMREFVDAWGSPIEWLRWAPGFVSDLQPQFRIHQDDPRAAYFAGTQPRDENDPEYITTRDPPNHPDPFNPLRVDRWEPGDEPPEYGYNIVPLIMSPGLDRDYGIYFGRGHQAWDPGDPRHPYPDADPYTPYRGTGDIMRRRGDVLHNGLDLDNIHNHDLSTRM